MANKFVVLIICLFMFMGLSSTVLAVRQVPGKVPNVEPLQPFPADTSANIQQNVYTPPTSTSSKVEGNDPEEGVFKLENRKFENDPNLKSIMGESSHSVRGAPLFFLVIIVAAAGYGLYVFLTKPK